MRAAVLGSPVAHSLSPVLHSAAYVGMGLTDWSYGRHECDEQGLAPFLAGLRQAEWAGLSLTMPLKRVALESAAWVSDLSLAVGGANTLVRRDRGWEAHNTDVAGIATALAEVGIGAPRSTVVLGAGATAASALAALRELGERNDSGGLGTIIVLARDTSRAGRVAVAAERLGVTIRVAPLAEIGAWLDTDLVVSTLPSGATDGHVEALARSRADLFDVVYAPWPTKAAEAVAARGGRVVGGFPMLLHQAVAQVRLMTGIEDVPVAAMRAAGEAELVRRAQDR